MYNGHKSRAAWNVALWLFNDEHMYREVTRVVAHAGPRSRAAL